MAPLRTEIWREGGCLGRAGADARPSHEAAGKGSKTDEGVS